MRNKNFSGYVLAGGKSSRMGTDKAFLEIGDETFIKRAVNVLKSVCGNRVQIVLNSNQKNFVEKLSVEADFIFDIFEDRGALGGIYTALKNCKSEFAVILAVDLPFVDTNAVRSLAKTAMAEKDFSAIVPRQNDGRLQPLCAVYQVKNCLSGIEKLLSKNDSVAVRKFLETINIKVVEEKFLSKNRNLFVNINTPAEYENLKNSLFS